MTGKPPWRLAFLAVFAGSCSVGPDYLRPSAPVSGSFKETAGWKQAEPSDALAKGPWWRLFADPELDGLEAQVDVSNQTVLLAEAQLRQARALVAAAQAGYFPTVGVQAGYSRVQRPPGLGVGGTAPAGANNAFVPSSTYSFYSLQGSLSWELDLWGRVRRTVEANRATAQASAADLENAKLSAQAQLAQNFLQLRALDASRELLQRTVTALEQTLALTRDRKASGVASIVDVLQAETQLETVRAQAIDLGVQRSQLEHAVAVLVGKPPAELSLPSRPLAGEPPVVPSGLPSSLLERRPDIAAAERRMAAANAQIGVAMAAFFPNLTFSASGGFESLTLGKLLSWPSRFWSLGANAAETVFEGGLRWAQWAQALATYDAAVAEYRATVLSGFQEVEDALAALRTLEEEAQVEDRAVKAAEANLTLTIYQYKAGTMSYLNVIVAQTTALANERTAVDILGRRMVAAVQLIKALGGGWKASQPPR